MPFATVAAPQMRLLVFARVPVLGEVKKRLAAEIGDERALEAYEAMLHDTLHSIGVPPESCEFEVLWAPTESADGELLARAFGDLPQAMQTGETLGDRMAMALSERFFFHGARKIIVIGVDDPLIPRQLIDEAFLLLDSCDWVIGPAVDGGYYLIGCRAAAFDVDMFRGIEWGSGSVFAETMEKIRAVERNVAVLPRRADIDRAEDLLRFAAGDVECELAGLLHDWGYSRGEAETTS